MNRKILTRLLSVLLVVVMTFGLLPVSASAAWWNRGNTEPQPVVDTQAATDNSNFIRAFHLDCGRKYFTVSEVKAIIDQLAANYYTHLELAFGNEGLRFIPDADKMAVGNYTGEQVVAALAKGNTAYDKSQRLSYTTDAWSEDEMTQIISYASDKGIEIIPMLDIPGHMNAVIAAMQELGISVSVFSQVGYNYPGNIGQSFDPTNAAAAAFAKGLVENYIEYFKGKCKYFNIAGDECGFAKMSDAQYTAYVDLMNDLNTTVKANGMTTMMFNDGVYYKDKTATNPLSTEIVICYWTGGDNYKTSKELADMGFTLLNTNVHWYYVAGNDSTWSTDIFSYKYAINSLKNKKCTECDGGGQITDFGCMLAFWCDNPTKDVNTSNLNTYIATLAAQNPDYFKATETPDTTQLTITSSSTTGALKTGESLTLTANMAANWSTGNAEVVDLDSDADGLSTVVTARSAGTATIKAAAQSDSSKTASYTVTVTDNDEPGVEKTVTISLTVGDAAHTETQNGVNNKGKENKSNLDEDIATVTVDGNDKIDDFKLATSITSGNQYYITDGNGNFLSLENGSLTNKDQANATLWTVTRSSGSGSSTRYTISSNGYYLYYSSSLTVSAYNSTDWRYSTTKGFYYNYYSRQYYIYYNNGWQVSRNASSNYGKAYTGETKPASTSITFTPVAEGTTEIIVGTIKYVIKVTAKETAKTISLNYGEASELATEITDEGTVTYTLTSGNDVVSLDNDGAVTAFETDGKATVVATVTRNGRKVAVYTFTINVSKVNLSNAAKLPIQLWITNQAIQVDQDGVTSTGISSYGGDTSLGVKAQYIYITADKAYGKDGAELSKCVPDLVYSHYENGGLWWIAPQDNKPATDLKLYKGVCITASADFQKIWGDSSVNKGKSFQYVRYYQGEWWASIDGSPDSWFTVTGNGSDKAYSTSSLKEQLIAYYYMRTKLTDEVITDVVDWGDAPNGQSDYALLDFAVKYEGGSRIPDTFPNGDKTRVMNTAGNVVTSGNYRIVDQIDVTNDTGYELYMITLTPTSGTLSSKVPSSYTYDYTQEKVTWAKSVEDLPEDYQTSDRWYSDQSGYTANGSLTFNATTGANVGGNPKLSFVEIEKQTGLLVTYYIRPVKEEVPDTLLVQYVDDTTGKVFYKYDIAVKEGTTFDTEPVIRNKLMEDYLVKGFKNDVTVTCDLTKMDGVPAAYRYANYTFVTVERSDDQKTMTLHYTFTRDFAIIADFGLPVTLKLGDVNSLLEKNKDRITSVVPKATGGKATVNADNSVTFTPNAVFGAAADLTITYAGTNITDKNENSIKYTIAIIPASNVLYEANFLKEGSAAEVASGINAVTWTDASTEGLTALGTQAVHKTTDTAQRYGYDDAYVNADSAISYWKVSGLRDAKTAKDGSVPLKTTFTGNGFDLIGSCGEDTGRVLVAIKNAAGKMVKAALVDTYLSSGTFNQVPLAHLMMDDTANAEYSVSIYAYGPLKARTTTSMRSAISTFAAPAMTADPVAATLNELGISWSDVEEISVADTLSAQAISENAVAVQSMPAARAAAADTTTTYSVTIDGFRVYRATNNTAYSAAEKDVTYANILDVVNGQITAFVDAEDGEPRLSVEDYEKNGGPQNEIYLLPHAEGDKILVQFKLEKDGQAYKNQPVQVSLRAVDGNNLVATYSSKSLTSVVEMYYQLTTDENGIVTIMNNPTDPTADNLAMLAIGNVKLPAGVTAVAPENVDNKLLLKAARAVITPEPVEPELFTPDTFKVHVTSLPMFRSKIVTLGITVSKDVAYVTVNGRTYTPSQFFSRWLKTVTIPVTETISRSETRTYTIIAYNSDGVASEPIVVKG